MDKEYLEKILKKDIKALGYQIWGIELVGSILNPTVRIFIDKENGVTVEDCVVQVPNRFELVMLAARRARSVSAGEPLTVERDNDKNPIVALREIAEEKIDLEDLRYELIRGLQKHVEVDEPEDDDMAALMEGKDGDEWSEDITKDAEESEGIEIL